ncbi:MAG: sulfurtransferase TusA family protein [Alphaproteobacteria bacterium]|nr:sulfurtransferase TusA family protein [Alphaproteobacteria bacterium]
MSGRVSSCGKDAVRVVKRADKPSKGGLPPPSADTSRAAPLGGNSGDWESIRVDARGYRCPTPTLMLAKALRRAAPGAVVELWADDPLARIDAPHFLAEAGHELIHAELKDGLVHVMARKIGRATKAEDAARH